ncbi:MAG: amino acid transporter substrate-binding protein [Massilibacillus sp.]|jgi:L-cystine transport system substrate-binding protein|nr:amino acid transporter substrate-binding protein [Massilibacillus sp.]
MNFIKTKKVFGIIVMAIIAIGLVGCGGQKAAKVNDSSQGQKIVRVAHTQTYVPYDFVNDKGESDGFEVQVLKEVAKLLPQYKFEFVPTSDDDLLIGVESGKYNVGIKGAWYTEQRKDKFVFPKEPVGASIIGFVFRKENAEQIKDIESFAKFSGKLVPIAPQNAQYAVIENFNKSHADKPIKLVSSEAFTIADAYTWVLEGRYDAYLDIDLSYKNNVEKESGAYHNLADKLSYVRYKAIPTYPLFNKKDQQFADDYDKAYKQLKESGKILELEKEYFGEDVFQYVKD